MRSRRFSIDVKRWLAAVFDGRGSDPIIARQAAALARNQWFSAAFNLMVVIVAALVLHGGLSGSVLFGWLAVTAAVFLGRFGSWAILDRRRARPRTRLRVFAIGFAMAGGAWGLLPVLMIGEAGQEQFIFVGFVIAGLTAASLASLCWYLPAFFGFLAGATLPLAGACLLVGGRDFLAMGMMILLYFILLCLTGYRYATTILETLDLQSAVRDALHRLDETQAELERAKRHKWEMLAHLGHELRTPMNAVIGLSETLDLELFGPVGHPRYKEYVGDIHASGRRALGMIEEILELSVAETGRLVLAQTRLPLAAIIGDALTEVAARAAARGVELDNRLPRDRSAVMGDEPRLRHVFCALLANAIRHTPAGGTVTLEPEAAAEGFRAIGIVDTGRGMSEDDIALALSPFGRLENPLSHDNEGIGLGLPLAKRMAELHGGTMRIQSARGSGTRVTLTLPVAGEPERSPLPGGEEPAPGFAPAVLLGSSPPLR